MGGTYYLYFSLSSSLHSCMSMLVCSYVVCMYSLMFICMLYYKIIVCVADVGRRSGGAGIGQGVEGAHGYTASSQPRGWSAQHGGYVASTS